MKHLKLYYTVEVGSRLTTLFIYLFFSFSESGAEAGSMAFRSRHFHAMYQIYTAKPHSLKLLKSLTKEQLMSKN